jgi:hypothetical protein
LASRSQWKGQRRLRFQNDSKCPEVFRTFLQRPYSIQSINPTPCFFLIGSWYHSP